MTLGGGRPALSQSQCLAGGVVVGKERGTTTEACLQHWLGTTAERLIGMDCEIIPFPETMAIDSIFFSGGDGTDQFF